MKARPLSINRPYGTFAGHTRSQLRQVRQRSRCDRSRGLSGRSPRASARIKAMRPRGDSFSVRVSRYVGQCGRHRPQATQRSASYLIFDARSKLFTADPRPAKGSSQRSHVSAHAAMRGMALSCNRYRLVASDERRQIGGAGYTHGCWPVSCTGG
jgi:hypothetical protein